MNRQIFQKAAGFAPLGHFPALLPRPAGGAYPGMSASAPAAWTPFTRRTRDAGKGNSSRRRQTSLPPPITKGVCGRPSTRMKFSGHPGSAATLAPLLLQALREGGAAEGRFDLLVPVPSRPKKVRARGYNQSALLARELSKRTGIPVSETALVKTRDTRAQHDLSAEERQVNLSGASGLPKARSPAGGSSSSTMSSPPAPLPESASAHCGRRALNPPTFWCWR